ncbi:MAG: fumarate hydratase [Clostridia bacterium]|nr:fumarate hydratase [Clostridia bacterium]
MKTVACAEVTERVAETIKRAGVRIDDACMNALQEDLPIETGAAKFALDVMINNALLAEKNADPVCQDTGMAVVFVTIGQEVRVTGGSLTDAINEGVRRAYRDNFFRKSVLDPVTRINTGDNTPAVIHYDLVEGDSFDVKIMLKGFGSENMSRLYMLPPSKGLPGVKECVLRTVREAGGNPCPPVLLGVGLGGTMEKAALLSKHALFREIGSINPDPELDRLEKEWTEDLNRLGVGPQGFGGRLTCVATFIEKFPTHLAGLPVAVTVQCHAVRHGGFSL